MHGEEDGDCDDGEPVERRGKSDDAGAAGGDLERAGQEAREPGGVEEVLEDGTFGATPLVVPEAGEGFYETGAQAPQGGAG